MNERATPETDALIAKFRKENRAATHKESVAEAALAVADQINALQDHARRLERQRDELAEAVTDLRTFHRVLFKHPGTAKNGIEHRQCRFCDSMWELGQAETHNGACISEAARKLLAKVKGGK